MDMDFELIIIGGGPAGTAATVYASRKQLKTLLVAKEFGGQSVVSEDIQNWIGFPSITGADLAKAFKKHVETYRGNVLTIAEGDEVEKIEKSVKGFSVKTKKGVYGTKTILITTGSHRRQLNVPGADRLEHKGLTYCASCDGPLFSDMDVAVIGGGNAGFETAAQLLAYTKSVTLLQKGSEYSADPTTVKKVLAHPKMRGVLNAETIEVYGEKFVTGLAFRHMDTGEEEKLDVSGIFVEIGMIPATDFAEGLLELDTFKRIVINPLDQKTSVLGIWAAGDCTNVLYHQNNIAAGDAVRALEDIYNHLSTK